MATQTAGLIGVGYEGRTVEAVISQLRETGVAIVVDVRLTPLSRKPGFSKRALAEALQSSGIEYRHLPALGNPRWNRAGFSERSTPDGDRARRRYTEVLGEADAREALDEIASLTQSGRVALLCFEADERHCHRELLIDMLVQAEAT